ncbi:MAG TPA: formate dehydrogenase accessory sulfurtransferase FdhD [Syntrophomonadaceae bacterium]|jgi:FdhD protein|nr:formate dehydrogenase accessory sulfurtransferase FdhD [Syntrophomonadaceae bacterium]HRX21038.1 formate dehydrogenase accessory sulfurtransferase FdhD [Syntrophomonadaceae bacterium]
MDITKEKELRVFEQGKWSIRKDQLVIEATLKIILNGIELVNIACSPKDTIQLAIGYLLSEGYLESPADIRSINNDDPCCIQVETGSEIDLSGDSIRINTCLGRGRTNASLQPLPAEAEPVCYSPAHLLKVINELDATSYTFQQTGGVHSAGLADNRQLLFRYEDIGRHNAVDKVIGQAFLQQIDLSDKCLLLSGRIAAEILMKTARNGIPLILSRSAPTMMAVETAEKLGLTVVGFARGQRFNLYCQSERIRFD